MLLFQVVKLVQKVETNCYVGGDEEAFKKAEPVIACYSQKAKLLGKSGSGQLTK